MKTRSIHLIPFALICLAHFSGCNSNSPSSPSAAATAAPAAYAGDLSLLDKNPPKTPRAYVLKVTFLADLELPALQKDNQGEGKLIYTQQVIQNGTIYTDFKPTWGNYSTLACGIGYATSANDMSFTVHSGDVVAFDLSSIEIGLVNPNDGTNLDNVTLMSSFTKITEPGGVDQISCEGKPGNLTATELVRTFGKDENGHQRIAADIMLKSDYEAQLK